MKRSVLLAAAVLASVWLARPTTYGEAGSLWESSPPTLIEALVRSIVRALASPEAIPATPPPAPAESPGALGEVSTPGQSPMVSDGLIGGEKKAREVLRQRCMACHGNKHRVVPKFNVLDWDALEASPYVVPGKPDESRIWQRVAMSEMPPAQLRPLAAEEKDDLKNGIEQPEPRGREKDIVAAVREDDRLTFLFKAAQAAGVLELLQNPGPFTILAPTDEAFRRLEENTCQALVDKKNREAAQQLLLNHGILGKYPAKDLEKLGQVSSGRGFVLTFGRSQRTQKLWIGPTNAVVVSEDIVCSNGVVHVIDQVIMPPEWPLSTDQLPRYPTKIALTMIEIPGGMFTMGSPPPLDSAMQSEGPQRRVEVLTFYLSEHEVTWEQYRVLQPKNPAPEWIRVLPPGQKPVGSVNWIQAAEFCNKLSRLERLTPYYVIHTETETPSVTVPSPGSDGYRLPTEAEWEYACRAGNAGKFSFGDDASMLGQYGWYSTNAGGRPNPVKMKKPNAWDLYDMHGNVGEWCEDWFGGYEAPAEGKLLVNPRGPAVPPSDTKRKVYRGGSYVRPPEYCRSTWRGSAVIEFQHEGVGIRVARTPPKPMLPLPKRAEDGNGT